jgi:hypothetical protein
LIDETLSGSKRSSLHVDPGGVYSMVGTNGDDLRGVPESVMRVSAVLKEMAGSAKARFSLS